MGEQIHPFHNVRWNYSSITKRQGCNVEVWEGIRNTLSHFVMDVIIDHVKIEVNLA